MEFVPKQNSASVSRTARSGGSVFLWIVGVLFALICVAGIGYFTLTSRTQNDVDEQIGNYQGEQPVAGNSTMEGTSNTIEQSIPPTFPPPPVAPPSGVNENALPEG